MQKWATMVIILSVRSCCAQEKWGSQEASSFTSRTMQGRSAVAGIVPISAQTLGLGDYESALPP
jgi:hypothetical protein